MPPIVQIQFATTFELNSPGQILGSVYMFDEDGLASLDLSVFSDDSLFVGDSLLPLTGAFEFTRPVVWTVPQGLATGTGVSVVARAVDFAGFSTSDTIRLVVQDST